MVTIACRPSKLRRMSHEPCISTHVRWPASASCGLVVKGVQHQAQGRGVGSNAEYFPAGQDQFDRRLDRFVRFHQSEAHSFGTAARRSELFSPEVEGVLTEPVIAAIGANAFAAGFLLSDSLTPTVRGVRVV